MKINVDEIPVLIRISKHDSTRGQITGRLQLNPDIFLTSLIDKNLIILNDETYSLTPDGENYMKEYNNLGIPETYKSSTYHLAILKFLYLLDKPIDVNYFPESIKNAAPTTSKGNTDEFKVIHYIEYDGPLKQYIDSSNNYHYLLNESGRRYYKHLLKEQEDHPISIPFQIGQIGDIVTNTSHGDNSPIVARDYIKELKEKDVKISEIDNKKKEIEYQLTIKETQLKDLDIIYRNLQIKEAKNKKVYAALGAIGGSFLTIIVAYIIYKLQGH